MYSEILPLLRDLRARYGDEAILDGGRLAGMLADVLSGGKEGERHLLLRVLSEGLPRRMLAGETADGTLHGWSSQLAGRFFINEDAIHAAILCWRNLLCPDAGGEPEKTRPATPPAAAPAPKPSPVTPVQTRPAPTPKPSPVTPVQTRPAPAPKKKARPATPSAAPATNTSAKTRPAPTPKPSSGTPVRERSPEWWSAMAAVRENGLALQYVPKRLRDREICLEAVRRFGGALEYVPEQLRDHEICLAAVRRFVGALQYVPTYLQNEIRRLARL